MVQTPTTSRVDEVRARGVRAVAVEAVREFVRLREQGWGNLWGYALIAPAVILYLVFEAWPIMRGVFMAFSDYRWLMRETHGLAGFNGLDNWRELFADPTFWHSLRTSALFSAMFMPIALALSLFTAVMISKVQNDKAAAVYRVIAYMPVVLPVTVAMLVWAKLYDVQFGYINVLLQKVGIANPPNWLGSPRSALYSMVPPTIWLRFGEWTLLFLIGIYNINREIYEAARVDGAGGMAQWWYITMPLLKPVFTLVLVLGTGIIGATVESMALFQGTTGGPGQAALTTGVYAYRTAFINGDMRMGYAASMSLFVGLVNMAITGTIFAIMRTERN